MATGPSVWSAWGRAILLLLAGTALAQDVVPANGTSSLDPKNSDDRIDLALKREDNFPTPPPAHLVPLLSITRDRFPNDAISGTFFPASTDNISDVNDTDIAWVSCDPAAYPGNQGAADVLARAIENRAKAVVFYSVSSDRCNYTADEDNAANYPFMFSMSSARDTDAYLTVMNEMIAEMATEALINLDTRVNTNNGTSGGQGGSGQPGGPSPTTAVAMIILYSITGVITALFLIIIVTGAIRAHRHPERYGPRAVLGRARQSRARGLARAMLDSIPIVKFGDNEGDIPKPGDAEMAAGGSNEVHPLGSEVSGAQKKEATTEIREDDGAPESTALAAAAAAPRPSHESVDGIQPDMAESGRSPATRPDESLGCSICTEDFERGEYVRVLPCNHKFHPPCIDPWLLNVSGTCPLCRIDLRPPTSHGPNSSDDTAESSGPSTETPHVASDSRLTVDETHPAPDSRRQSKRLSFFFDPLNRLRMQEATPAERIEALRQYNERNRDENRRRKRLSNRMDALLGRLRRHGDGAAEQAQPDVPSIPPNVLNRGSRRQDDAPESSAVRDEPEPSVADVEANRLTAYKSLERSSPPDAPEGDGARGIPEGNDADRAVESSSAHGSPKSASPQDKPESSGAHDAPESSSVAAAPVGEVAHNEAEDGNARNESESSSGYNTPVGTGPLNSNPATTRDSASVASGPTASVHSVYYETPESNTNDAARPGSSQ